MAGGVGVDRNDLVVRSVPYLDHPVIVLLQLEQQVHLVRIDFYITEGHVSLLFGPEQILPIDGIAALQGLQLLAVDREHIGHPAPIVPDRPVGAVEVWFNQYLQNQPNSHFHLFLLSPHRYQGSICKSIAGQNNQFVG